MRYLVLLLGLACACAQSPQQRAQVVCAAFCDCVVGTGSPGAVQQCIDTQCLPVVGTVTDTCLTCVDDFESTCSSLVNNCDSECFTPVNAALGGSR